MKKALLSLLGAALLLGAVFGFLRWREEAASRPRPVFPGAQAEDAVRLSIRYMQDSVVLLRKDGHWVTLGDHFPVDESRVLRVFGYLAAIQAFERVSDSADARQLGEYGLDADEEKRVEWEMVGGRIYRVLLGKISGIDFGSVFWKHDEGAEIYRTPGKFVWEFSSRARDWKDTNLYYPHAPFRSEDVQAVEVEWHGAAEADSGLMPLLSTVTYRLERSGDTGFVLTQPVTAEASAEAARKIFLHAAQFKIDDFVMGEDASATQAALDAPVMTIRFSLRDGTERVVTAGAVVDGLYRYVRHASHPAPMRVFKWRFEYFRKRGEDFVENGK